MRGASGHILLCILPQEVQGEARSDPSAAAVSRSHGGTSAHSQWYRLLPAPFRKEESAQSHGWDSKRHWLHGDFHLCMQESGGNAPSRNTHATCVPFPRQVVLTHSLLLPAFRPVYPARRLPAVFVAGQYGGPARQKTGGASPEPVTSFHFGRRVVSKKSQRTQGRPQKR